ncbi:MAG: biotin transporter BioY [Simkaniaceae bacterium]|nr:biotin transporter BioY [Candidatus Sacchlamyda saccharinae]
MQHTQTLPQKRIQDLFVVLGASILLALSAWISIPLPLTPVPVSFTAPLVLLLSVLLGKKGAYATALYVAQGAMGLPVFAGGGATLAYLMGPTGGYLIGFVISSYVVGSLAEKIQNKTPLKTFGLMLFGNALIFAFGLPHLALLIGTQNALKFGLYPFLGLDLLKLLVVNRLVQLPRK